MAGLLRDAAPAQGFSILIMHGYGRTGEMRAMPRAHAIAIYIAGCALITLVATAPMTHFTNEKTRRHDRRV